MPFSAFTCYVNTKQCIINGQQRNLVIKDTFKSGNLSNKDSAYWPSVYVEMCTKLPLK